MQHVLRPEPKRELFHIAGDVPDITGSGLRGVAATHDFRQSAYGRPLIFYRDLVLEFDVYRFEGLPTEVHIICPRCHNHLRLSALNKRIEYDRDAPVPVPPGWTRSEFREVFTQGAGGLLSMEPFGCTWELGAARQMFGLSLCGWRVAIENNIARDV